MSHDLSFAQMLEKRLAHRTPVERLFAARLWELRTAARLTQEELAVRVRRHPGCGTVSQDRLSRLETGSRPPALKEIAGIAAALCVSLSALIDEREGRRRE